MRWAKIELGTTELPISDMSLPLNSDNNSSVEGKFSPVTNGYCEIKGADIFYVRQADVTHHLIRVTLNTQFTYSRVT